MTDFEPSEIPWKSRLFKNGVSDKANDRFELMEFRNEGLGFRMSSRCIFKFSRLVVLAKIKDNAAFS